MTVAADAPCRVCGSARTTVAGQVEYFSGFNWTVRDCQDCGCRFTPHDAAVHDQFHAAPALSYYRDYASLMERCRVCFARGDLAGLERELRGWSKYRFVIDHAAKVGSNARVLEVGCSRGYLTSYFILSGRNVLGTDVSPEAIDAARNAFGHHFAPWGAPAVDAHGPYDLIYHVGVVGCVADPIGLTDDLLGRLAPGGRLIFNAPNRDALDLAGQLWIDSAPPPDLVTLFPPGFWSRRYAQVAKVVESVETLPADQSWRRALAARLGARWRAPQPQPLSVRGHEFHQGPGPADAWPLRALSKLAQVSGVTALAAPRPAEFGLFVSMTRLS